MIYILLINGASIVPFFLPGLPQLLLVSVAFRVLYARRLSVSWPIYLILIFLCLLLILSGFSGLPDQSIKIGKFIINALVAYIFAVGLVHRYGENFPYYYSRALFFFTSLGILGSILTLITDRRLSYAIGTREYHTNFLTTWLTDAGFNSSHTFLPFFPYRLQSLFDEPGTFGMLLVPAFFYYVKEGKIKESLVLAAGTVLSESANAWALCLIILLYKVWVLNSKLAKYFFVLVFIALLAIVSPSLIHLYEIKAGIDDAYANSSSLDTRRQEYSYIQQNWLNHLLPFQSQHIATEFPDGISVSYVSWYIYGGIIFVIMLLSIVIAMIMAFLRGWRLNDKSRHFLTVLALILILSGAQRSSLFDNILFMTLAFWTLLHKAVRNREINASST